MSRSDPYWSAANAAEVAERVVRDQSLTELPIDPMALARDQGISVLRKPARAQGVSGMLLRRGNTFGIIYATHIDSIGFQNFSVAHELGHYYLPGHIDAVLSNHEIHESRAGFASGDRYEIEADHFAATLLMPRALFRKAMSTFGDGLAAIEKLAEQCRTSLTATAIRYARCTREAVAVVLSTGTRINYCFMSDALKDVEGFGWIRKGEGIARDTATFAFNQKFEALLKQVWVELEPIRRVHEGRRRRRGSSELTRGFRFRGGRAVACCGCRGRVAEGRPACQRATRVLRWAPVLRMTRRPSLRSESSYGPCGPAWTGASRPSTTSRRAREE